MWALDTTYIPMARGFVYLTAVVDVASRRVLAHRIAITLEAIHAKDVIEQALTKYGAPEIVNTDQGSQFTAEEFTRAVLHAGCKLSMHGRHAWRDNVFVERLWRSVKHQRVEKLAKKKLKSHKDVVHLRDAEDKDPEQGGAEIIDLVQLLRQSLGGKVTAAGPAAKTRTHAEAGATPAHADRTNATGENELKGKTRDQLQKLAADLGISGRSKLHKDELLKAVKSAMHHKAA